MSEDFFIKLISELVFKILVKILCTIGNWVSHKLRRSVSAPPHDGKPLPLPIVPFPLLADLLLGFRGLFNWFLFFLYWFVFYWVIISRK